MPSTLFTVPCKFAAFKTPNQHQSSSPEIPQIVTGTNLVKTGKTGLAAVPRLKSASIFLFTEMP
jgi:hypothetical protein